MKTRIHRAVAAATFALPLPALAIEIPSTAIVVTVLGEGRVVLGDDGKDHAEYDLLVTNVFDKPVTLSRLEVLNPAGEVLMTMEGGALTAATQTLILGEPLAAVPASGAAALEVDLVVAPGTAPAEVNHRLTYTIPSDSAVAAIVGTTTVQGPLVAIDHRPATVILSPLAGPGWAAINGCCTPNIHRNVRIGAGTHIARPELFAIDWVQLDGDRLFSGDGKSNADYAFFGHPLRAVADGTVVDLRDGMKESTPFAPVTTVKKPDDYGGNYIVLQIAPEVYAFYAHLQPGSLKVKVGDEVQAGAIIARLGNTGNSTAPHLHFGLVDSPDFLNGEGLPFVIDRFTVTGLITGGELSKAEITPQNRVVENAYPLVDGVVTYE
jgi:hypothetical protein